MRDHFYLFFFMIEFSTGCILSNERQTTSITGYTGGSVMLLCSCADPQSTAKTFTWQFNDGGQRWIPVFKDEKYSGRRVLFNESSPQNLSLLISGLRKEDQGFYMCKTEQYRYIHLIVNDIDLPQPKAADIVFLVDGSINLGRGNFKEVMDFILNLIDLFFNERDKLQIGLAHYATDVTDVFYLNTYKNKDDIISAITQAEYKGGREIKTGNAIRHVQKTHFIKERGSRKDEGIPQILMVVTGGRSRDDSKTAALGLKASGVRIYAVGVGDIEDELNKLGSETTMVARASTFQDLFELNEQILETLDDEVKGIVLYTGVKDPTKVTLGTETPHIHTSISLSTQELPPPRQPHHTPQYLFILVAVFPLALILPFLALSSRYAKDEVACSAIVYVETAFTPDHTQNDAVEFTEFVNTNAEQT